MKEAMESQSNSSANRRSWRNSYGSEQGNEDNFPDEFYCSITLEVMREPVLAADGFSYEKAAIEDWFAKGHRTSPKTGLSPPSLAIFAVDRLVGAQMKNTELQGEEPLTLLAAESSSEESDPGKDQAAGGGGTVELELYYGQPVLYVLLNKLEEKTLSKSIDDNMPTE
eukprot:766991-Hanusia_phi.AAC.17